MVFSLINQTCNTSSPSIFSVVEMVSLLQVYATTGLNLLRKVMNTKGCRISFHSGIKWLKQSMLKNVANLKVHFSVYYLHIITRITIRRDKKKRKKNKNKSWILARTWLVLDSCSNLNLTHPTSKLDQACRC